MPATAVAAITAFEMILRSENHYATGFKIKIARLENRLLFNGMLVLKCRHTLATDAGAVALLRRHAGQQFGGKFNRRAPASAFAGVVRAKPAFVRFVAQWTTRQVVFRRRRNRSFSCAGHESRTRELLHFAGLTSCAAPATSAFRPPTRMSTSPVPAQRKPRLCRPCRSIPPIANI